MFITLSLNQAPDWKESLGHAGVSVHVVIPLCTDNAADDLGFARVEDWRLLPKKEENLDALAEP